MLSSIKWKSSQLILETSWITFPSWSIYQNGINDSVIYFSQYQPVLFHSWHYNSQPNVSLLHLTDANCRLQEYYTAKPWVKSLFSVTIIMDSSFAGSRKGLDKRVMRNHDSISTRWLLICQWAILLHAFKSKSSKCRDDVKLN